MLTPLLEPPGPVIVPEKFAAAAVSVPVIVGDVNDLLVIVCVAVFEISSVPAAGKISVLEAEELWGAACSV